MMSVLIGGGSGFIGRHLTKLLEKNGMSVTWVSRSPGPNRITWDDLQRDGLPTDCTAVVSLSGAKILNPFKRWSKALKREVWRSRVDYTKTLAVAAFRAYERPPKVFITFASVGYYKPDPDAEYDEDSPSEGDGDIWMELCRDWEEAAKLPHQLGTRQVIIRSGIVLGSDGGLIPHLFLPFFLGLGGRIGSGRQWFPWIHVTDAAGLVHHAIVNEHIQGVLNGVTPVPVTNDQFTKEFARAMMRPAVLPVPEVAVSAVYGPERARLLLEGQRVHPRRTLETGYKYVFASLPFACKHLAQMYLREGVTGRY